MRRGYRYRLSNITENRGLLSRSIDDIHVYKNRWIYSERPLFQDHLHLLDEDECDLDSAGYKYEKVGGSTFINARDLAEKNYSKDELINEALKRGFSKAELSDLDKKGLVQLLYVDITMHKQR